MGCPHKKKFSTTIISLNSNHVNVPKLNFFFSFFFRTSQVNEWRREWNPSQKWAQLKGTKITQTEIFLFHTALLKQLSGMSQKILNQLKFSDRHIPEAQIGFTVNALVIFKIKQMQYVGISCFHKNIF